MGLVAVVLDLIQAAPISSLLLTVTGRPLRRSVFPHEAGGMTAFAATEASSTTRPPPAASTTIPGQARAAATQCRRRISEGWYPARSWFVSVPAPRQGSGKHN